MATRRPELLPTPLYVFDRLRERGGRPRFHVPLAAGGWAPVTWQAFADQIRAVAGFARSVGLGDGDRVAIFAPNRVEWMAAGYGANAAGGVAVPVYPSSTAEQAAYVVEHSDARLVFVDTAALVERVLERWDAYAKVERVVVFDDTIQPAQIARQLAERGVAVPSAVELEQRFVSWSSMTRLGLAAASDEAALVARIRRVDLDAPGLMIYTSGTTGNPKGVPLTHRNTGANALDWVDALTPPVREDMTDLLWLPMSHIFGYGEVTNGNMLGWTSWLATPKDALEKIREVRPDVFMSVPAYWEKLAVDALKTDDPAEQRRRLEASTGGRLEFCLSGGAGLKPRVKEVFSRAGLLILEGYGLTETAPTLTLNRADDVRFDSVGKPLASVRIKLAPDGEIWAKGPNVFGGYHKDPLATREAFTEDGWFKTGDIGRFTEDGFLQIVDRKKEILVTAGGKNVPPANIELRFKDDPFIAQVVVYGDGKNYLVAGVWLNADAVAEHLAAHRDDVRGADRVVRELVEDKIQSVNREVASFESIKKFAIMSRPLSVEDGTLTPSLKLRRKKVYEQFRAELEAIYAS
jgi:long-chain acyl-CoA synthetase